MFTLRNIVAAIVTNPDRHRYITLDSDPMSATRDLDGEWLSVKF